MHEHGTQLRKQEPKFQSTHISYNTPLGVAVGVDVNLGQGVEGGRLGDALVETVLKPGQEQLQAITLLQLRNQLVRREVAAHSHDEVADNVIAAIHIQQGAHDNGQT
jgi:hypothetical protein